MNQSTKLYFDVTQLAHWSGRLAGIPRVINELAIRFAREPNVHFVVWVKELKAMAEIDFPRTMAQRGQGIVYVHEGQSAAGCICRRRDGGRNHGQRDASCAVPL